MADDGAPQAYVTPYTAALWRIESGGNPNAVTGSNRGLSQNGPAEEREFGINDSNRNDPAAQARGVDIERARNAPRLRAALGREPTDAEHYIAHQQGVAGGPALLGADQSTPAWQVIRPYYGSDRVAQKAITGNIPSDHALSGVPAGMITAGDFTNMWRNRFDRELQRVGGATGPMGAAFQRAQGPMAAANDATGSIPTGATALQGQRRMADTPMDAAQDPSMLGQVMRGVEAFDPSNTMQNAAAWLMAGANPAGGAALLSALKKNKNNQGTWSHSIDQNTGQIVSVNSKDGSVRTTPLPGFDKDKPAHDAYDRTSAEEYAKLNDTLANEGSELGGRRELLTQAKDAFGKLSGGPLNNQTLTQLKSIGNAFGMDFKDVPDIQVAQAISNRMALEARSMGGKSAMPGSMSDADREFLQKETANPSNSQEANKRILDIYEKQLGRQEDVERTRQAYVRDNKRLDNGFREAITTLDKKRAATMPGYPTGITSVQVVQ
jgi:hypothetical protein